MNVNSEANFGVNLAMNKLYVADGFFQVDHFDTRLSHRDNNAKINFYDYVV